MKEKDSEKQMKGYYRRVTVVVIHRGEHLEEFDNTDEALEYIGENELRGAKLIYFATAYEDQFSDGAISYAESSTFREACKELEANMKKGGER